MIQPESLVKITDNSGAKVGKVFKILGSSKKRYARIGDLVVLSVKSSEPRRQAKKKDVLHAVVVRQKQPFKREDGSYIKFDENAVVAVEKEKKEPLAGRIFGPIPREIQALGYKKIASLAPEIV